MALEDALTACEDWLYEEDTYAIIDAAVFDHRLAQLQALMEANMSTMPLDGEDNMPDDAPPDDVS